MGVLQISQESIEQGARILKNGGLVAFPTETVYGLGADAFNPKAIAKIFDVKKRPFFDPLIIHTASFENLADIANLSLLNNEAKEKLFILAQNFWPGPLSIVMPKNEKIPGIATAGLRTAAVRIPDNDAALKLISLSGGAVAAPSANLFGSLSPTRAEHVQSGLGDKIDMILDGGPARVGIESTVLDITGGEIKILRPGGAPRDAIEKLIGKVGGTDTNEQRTMDSEKCFSSPGQLKNHYAPHKPLHIFNRDDIINQPYDRNCAFLFFDGNTKDAWYNQLMSIQDQKNNTMPHQFDNVKVLSESGNMLEAASRLFEILHEFDNSAAAQCARIYAQLVPDYGLGEAINDRLKRGSLK